MGATYTSNRDRGRLRGQPGTPSRRHQLTLVAISLLSALMIVWCYSGRMRAFDRSEQQRNGQVVVNLMSVSKAEELETVMAAAFENAADRRFAARELLTWLGTGDHRRQLDNVGAIARISVAMASIDQNRTLAVFADRARRVREAAAVASIEAPATVPLFTAGEVAALKTSLIVRTRESHRFTVLWCSLLFLACFQAVALAWRMLRIDGDFVLLAAAHVLTTLGFLVMLSRPDPLRDTLLLFRHTETLVVALAVCVAASMLKIRTAPFLRLSYVLLGAAVLLSLLLIVLGSGPGSSGAKVNLGPVQPIEAIRLLIVLFLTGYLGRRWELVRQLRETDVLGQRVPAWLNLPRFDHMLPIFGGVGIALVLFFALRDLGPALLLSVIFLSVLAIARARLVLVATGIAVLVGGFYAGYWLDISRTLTTRVQMWQSPWNNAVRGGDQVAQAAWAMATGAIRGTGLGLGDTRYLPAGHTDLVMAAVGEELGVLGIFLTVAACGVLAWRGLRLARSAATDTAMFLAVAMTLSLVAPMLVMAAGILGLVPLTGVVTPFMSYGGSAMIVNFAALGLLEAVSAGRSTAPATEPFHVPVRWLGRTLAAAAVILLIAWGRVQVVSADAYLIKAQLSVQADGGLRYQYNPRLIDASRLLPRGTVLDRRDVPVAGNLAAVRAGSEEYARLHVALDAACPRPEERCYPFGGATFHLLGDAETRANWTATNTSYIERDEEDLLRGYDDRATAVRTQAGDFPPTVTLKRDYRDLIPLIRHRWDPEHPDVKPLMTRSRDLHLTIDVRLQQQVASILSSIAATGIERAAVVVLDANTGEVLASVSHPWPEAEMPSGTDGLLDRARYGLYPPGSTFKLVTAAAALRVDRALSQQAFTCSALPDGRIGARIPGLRRPVRDDVLDKHPHGTLTMHDGIVKSCNAYFAQLAVRVGAPALSSTAALAGISYPTGGPPAQVRESLPYSGYGQGQVLASPLRMARVAAAIGSDGQIREHSIILDADPPAPRPFLSEESSQLLGGYMRDVVTSGTGRLLRNHPLRIAGKTGTAELDDAKSHAWFIGFAPYGPATQRIAFAVLLENAGYGGASAASVAGQVVTSAASLGLIK